MTQLLFNNKICKQILAKEFILRGKAQKINKKSKETILKKKSILNKFSC